jgi:2-polyprenyl-3-methyl-5-hydroxy-6-metoxy-1,4-benzoquinol methylase
VNSFTDLQTVACPICNSPVSKKKYLVQNWHIVQCRQCGFVYVNPRLSDAAIINLYKQDYFHNREFGYADYNDNPHLKKSNFNKWISEALPFVNGKENLLALDVGCAAGFALETYTSFKITADGLDLDRDYIDALTKKGFRIYTKPLLENEYERRYDIISLFDVVEHLTDLPANFNKLQTLLKTNGILIIVTPNYNSNQRKLFGKKWFQFKPIEHINYFTKNQLTQLAASNGLELLICKKSGQYADTAFFMNRLQKYHFRPVGWLLKPVAWLLSRFKKSFYLDAASIYCVFRKK